MFLACDNGLINRLVLKGFIIMTTSIATNANIQQQAPAYEMIPEFRPSYNAVQLNMNTPTLNAVPIMPPAPETASKEWVA